MPYSSYSTATLGCAPQPSPSSSGSDSGLTAGGGLLIAFFVILFVYLVAGMGYNYHTGHRGIELVPHISFWRTIPSLIKEGFIFSFVDCFGLRNARAAKYSSFSANQTQYNSI